jgi:hypothetical protein
MTAAAIAYVPQPGTIAARAMAILDLLPEGQSIPNAVLATQLEQTSNVVLASLRPAERHGVVVRCSEGGYAVRWRKGDGTPPPATYGDPDETDDAPPVHRIIKARPGDITLPETLRGQLGAPPPVSGDFEHDEIPPPKGAEAAQVPATPPCGRDDATPKDGVVPQGSEFRCALRSDGRLHIETYPGSYLLLTQDETRQLVRYLERMGESADA